MQDLLNNDLRSGDRIVIISNGKIVSQNKRVIFKSADNGEVRYGYVGTNGTGSGFGVLNLNTEKVAIAKFKSHYTPREKSIIKSSC